MRAGGDDVDGGDPGPKATAGRSPVHLVDAGLKRVIDLLGAAALLAVASPIMVVAGLLIRLESPGPALYRAERLGRGGEPFTVFKLRSMAVDADDAAHREYVLGRLRDRGAPTNAEMHKLTDDPRVTRVGAILRRTSLDELPQLFNVLRGEMSLVGPRPEVPYAVEAYEGWHRERFTVLPGLTGLWQVSGRASLSPRDMLALDVEYARDRSLLLDLRILCRTVLVVFRQDGAA